MTASGLSTNPGDSFAIQPDGLPDVQRFAASPEGRRETTESRLSELKQNPRPDDPDWNLRLAGMLLRHAEADASLRCSIRAVELAADDIHGNILAPALRMLSVTRLYIADVEGARAAVTRLEEFARTSREPIAFAHAAEARGYLLLRTGEVQDGDFFEAESRLRQAMRLYRMIGDRDGVLRSMDALASVLAGLGEYSTAIEVVDEALPIAVAAQKWRFIPWLLATRAFALRDLGMHLTAGENFRLAIAWGEALGDLPMLARSLMGHAVLLGYEVTAKNPAGLPEVEAMFQRAIDLALQTNAPNVAAEAYAWWADLLEKVGIEPRAEELRDLGGELLKRSGEQVIEKHRQMQETVEAGRLLRFVARIRAALDGMSDALLVLDPVRDHSGKVVDLINEFRNRAGDRRVGAVPTDVRTLSQIVELPAFAGLQPAIWSAIERREAFSDERELPEGSWCGRHVVPAGDGVAVIVRDVSLEHVANEALRDAAERAQAADRAKSEFLANMSHEVRTPINGVLGLARLLEGTTLDEAQRSYVEGIASSAHILLRVIGDVLDLSKIEAGKIEIEPRTTPIRDLMRQITDLLRGQAISKGIRLQATVAPDVPQYVAVDGARLRQVLANLIGNAVKFTRVGTVEVSVSRMGSSLRFEVSDTGQGIASERLETIFEAFQQGGTEATVRGGTGLGLTISRRIVELMGGRIGVLSRVGQGSRFWFEVPLIEAAPEVKPVETNHRRFDGVHVLVVEDNPVNVMVAVGMLQALGCDTEVAEDGAKAVEIAANGTFDAILMDVRMPVMDGLEATRRLRAAGNQTPIIALTASAFTDDRDECFQAGMDDYLGKPFSKERLATALGKWVKE